METVRTSRNMSGIYAIICFVLKSFKKIAFLFLEMDSFIIIVF